MFKNILLFVLFCATLNVLSAQRQFPSQLIKYITTAPDGTAAITIYDDSRSNLMQLEAVHGFYKYQLTNITTKKKVYTRENQGNRCIINKSVIADGTYDLKLFTKDFIISSRITIAAIKEKSIALNESSF